MMFMGYVLITKLSDWGAEDWRPIKEYKVPWPFCYPLDTSEMVTNILYTIVICKP